MKFNLIKTNNPYNEACLATTFKCFMFLCNNRQQCRSSKSLLQSSISWPHLSSSKLLSTYCHWPPSSTRLCWLAGTNCGHVQLAHYLLYATPPSHTALEQWAQTGKWCKVCHIFLLHIEYFLYVICVCGCVYALSLQCVKYVMRLLITKPNKGKIAVCVYSS